MKVWPPGKRSRLPLGMLAACWTHRHAHSSPDLADWVIQEEKLLVEARFGGDVELYRAWRDRLWIEMHETMHKPAKPQWSTGDEEYVVMTAFEGNWAQYRVCRDRLREELWQIMKVTSRR